MISPARDSELFHFEKYGVLFEQATAVILHASAILYSTEIAGQITHHLIAET